MTVIRNLAIIAALIGVLYGLEVAGITTTMIVAVLFLWVLPVIVGCRISAAKNRDSPIPLAILFSWLGIAFALALPPAGHRCSKCDETIRLNAKVCRYCGAPQTHLAEPG